MKFSENSDIVTKIDDIFATSEEITEEEMTYICNKVHSVEQLMELADGLSEERQSINDGINVTSENAKQWGDAKKRWQKIRDSLDLLIIRILESMSLPKITSENGVILSTRNGRTLEVDDETVLAQFSNEVNIFKAKLPTYVKVSLSVDKRELMKELSNNPNLISESIHWQENKTLSVK